MGDILSPIFIFLKNWMQDTVLPSHSLDPNRTLVMGSPHIPQPHKDTKEHNKKVVTPISPDP